MENILETENAGKTYRVGQVEVPALKNISVQIPRASFASFIGSKQGFDLIKEGGRVWSSLKKVITKS
jgi:hypothetical protein